MHWVLQNNLFNEDAYGVLLETLVRFGIPHSIHKVIPFIGQFDPEPVVASNNVICMGSYSMRHSAKKNGWVPGVFDLEPFDFNVQLEHWGSHMLNSGAKVLPLRDAVVGEKPAFLRPIQDSKAFAGKVYDHFEFEEFKAGVLKLTKEDGPTVSGDTMIQVCPLKEIYSEYRFWIVKGEIICASLYKQGRRVFYSDDVPEAYFDFVRAMIAIWQPLEAFVIDVASVPDDGDGWLGIKIVEINSLCSSGFYACNIQKLVMALEDGFNV